MDKIASLQVSTLFRCRLLGMILLLLLLGAHSSPAAPRYRYLHLDHFDAPAPPRVYSSYYGETVIPWKGYGIYYEKARVQLRHVPVVSQAKQALRIAYTLPPHLDWGNWLSIRREFESLQDLHEYEGLALEVRTESAVNSQFRITLTDVTRSQDAHKHGADELWWYDAPVDFLTPSTRPVTIHAPFRDFHLGYGAGVRINDSKLDLSKIVAFEINLVSSGTYPGGGALTVDCLRAYKQRSSRARRHA